MICRLRPLSEGRLAPRTFFSTLLVAACVACSSSAETSPAERGDDSTAAPTSPWGDSSCAPDVSGLVPAGIEPIEIRCPRGYTQRATFAALPIAGRFTTLEELTEAFCIEKSPTVPAVQPPTFGDGIDFEKNDVIVHAFDARAGVEPEMLARGAELWLRVTTTVCTADAPVLASVAFVVPKATKVNEQKCSLRCD